MSNHLGPELLATTRQLQIQFGGLPNEEICEALSMLGSVGKIWLERANMIRDIERNTFPVDWQDLEGWAQKVEARSQESDKLIVDVLTALGFDRPDIGLVEAPNFNLVELIQASPSGKELQRMLGPNWPLRFEELRLLNPTEQTSMNEQVFRCFLSKRIEVIMNCWKKLWQVDGYRAAFREGWAQLTLQDREKWLQNRHIRTQSHAHIGDWAGGLGPGSRSPKRRLFLSSSLSINDLASDNVLPDFLDARAVMHPIHFRHSDSCSVRIGAWTGFLAPICVPGMIVKFSPEVSDRGRYCVSLERSNIVQGSSLQSNPNEENPYLAILQLEAQQYVYEFLRNCLENCPNDHSSPNGDRELSGGSANEELVREGAYPSLLTRAVRLDYYGRPGTIDLKYLDEMVNASLEEARDDFWQLREDHGMWMQRLDETPGTSPGRTANFLGTIFGRIDTFHTLSRHLASLKNNEALANQIYELDMPGQSDCGEVLELLLSLHIALESALQEQLCRLSKVSWPEATATSSLLSRLFTLLKENDATLRVLGLAEVMRTIDGEMQKVRCKDSFAFAMMHALNDVSILACCLKESVKHYKLVSDSAQHRDLGNKLEKGLETQDRPWRSVVEGTLTELGEAKSRQLDEHIRNQSIDAKSRYFVFWQVVDGHMASSSEGLTANENVVREIREAAPVDVPQSLIDYTKPDWVGKPNDVSKITQTMLRRSKNRPDIQAMPLVSAAEQVAEERPLPVIRPQRDIEFWNALTAPSSEDNSDLSWDDFEKAMEGIGYKVTCHGGGGAARQFRFSSKVATNNCASGGVPGAIVFHKPHKNGNKLPHRYARTLWLRRLHRKFILDL